MYARIDGSRKEARDSVRFPEKLISNCQDLSTEYIERVKLHLMIKITDYVINFPAKVVIDIVLKINTCRNINSNICCNYICERSTL